MSSLEERHGLGGTQKFRGCCAPEARGLGGGGAVLSHEAGGPLKKVGGLPLLHRGGTALSTSSPDAINHAF